MHVTVTSQPDPLVTYDEAAVAVGESGTDRRAYIEGLILAAQGELDGPTGWVGISVAPQTVEARFDAFCDLMRLPYGPVRSIASIDYYDPEGDVQNLGEGIFGLFGDDLMLLPDQSWPETIARAGAVVITYDVGVPAPEDDTAAIDPRIALMKAAIIQHVKMTLDHEEPEKRRQVIRWLVQPLRVWGSAA